MSSIRLFSAVFMMIFSSATLAAIEVPLKAPAGYYRAVQGKNITTFSCPLPPTPYTGDLNFPSKYEGDAPSKDTINKAAEKRYTNATAAFRQFEKGIIKLAETAIKKGKSDAPVECMVQWYTTWIDANALVKGQTNHIGKAVRKWALGSASTAWLRVKLAADSPYQHLPKENIAKIEKWLNTIALLVVEDYQNRGTKKANNHDYWAAWSVMATAVILNDHALFEKSANIYEMAMTQIDKDGFLPNELTRNTRALGYHSFALQPLSMMHVFLTANNHSAAAIGKGKLEKLTQNVLLGINDPKPFADKTGFKQITDQTHSCSSLAWIEPLHTAFPNLCMAQSLARCRPMLSTRMGGNMTTLFANNVKDQVLSH